MYGDFWAILKNIHFQVKIALAIFWQAFGNIWTTFYIGIWSHCECEREKYVSEKERVLLF